MSTEASTHHTHTSLKVRFLFSLVYFSFLLTWPAHNRRIEGWEWKITIDSVVCSHEWMWWSNQHCGDRNSLTNISFGDYFNRGGNSGSQIASKTITNKICFTICKEETRSSVVAYKSELIAPRNVWIYLTFTRYLLMEKVIDISIYLAKLKIDD